MTLFDKFLLCLFTTLPFVSCSKTEPVYIAKYKGDKECAISYTFDDGTKDHYTHAFTQLEKNGFKGTFWVCGDWVNEVDGDSINPQFVNWDELKEMADKGHEISNHSWSHPCLSALSEDSIRIEIEKNDSMIFSKIGIRPKTFSYPYGCVNELVTKIASENRVSVRTKLFGIGGTESKSTPESLRNIIQDLLKNKGWGVAMIHGINEGYDHFLSPEILWNHFEEVKKMEDKIWVDTFEKIASYQKQREDIKLDIQKGENTYTITPQLSLDKNLFTEPLTMVIKAKNVKTASVKQGEKQLNHKMVADKLLFDFDPFDGIIEVILEI